MEQTLTSDQKQLRTKRIDFLFNLFTFCASITIIVTIGFALLVILNSNEVFRNFIFNFFKQIPYVGQPLHLFIKSMNVVDLQLIYNQLLLPMISIELVYYSIFLIIFEVLVLIFKYKFKKNSRDYFAFFFMTIVLGTLILFKQVNLIVIPIAQGSALASRNLFIQVLLITQFISIIAIAFNYNKLGQFDLKEFVNNNVNTKMIHIGAAVIIVSLLLFSSVLLIANTQVDTIKDTVAVDYTLDFKFTADGLVHIELPTKLVITSKLLGFNIPKTIEGGALLQYFDVSAVNIGEIVSQFALDFIDNIAYQYLIIPMTNAMITVLLIVLLVLFNMSKHKIPFSSLTTNTIQFIGSLIISIYFVSKFGIILSMFGALMLVASGLNTYICFKDSSHYLKLQHLLQTKRQA